MNFIRKKLAIKYIPLAKSICKKFPNIDYQERYSIALYNLVIAANKFDFDNYDLEQFPSYARVIVTNALFENINKNKDVTVDWQAVEMSDEYNNYLKKYLQSDDQFYDIEFLHFCRQKLIQNDIDIVEFLLDGYTQSEIAEKFNISQASINRQIKNIRSDLRNELFKN